MQHVVNHMVNHMVNMQQPYGQRVDSRPSFPRIPVAVGVGRREFLNWSFCCGAQSLRGHDGEVADANLQEDLLLKMPRKSLARDHVTSHIETHGRSKDVSAALLTFRRILTVLGLLGWQVGTARALLLLCYNLVFVDVV